MTAATAQRASAKERLEDLLDYMAQGCYPPPFCGDCVKTLADHCDPCAQLAADFAVVNAAIGKVQQAPDYVTALAVYMRTVMYLTGIFPGSAAVLGERGAL